MVLSDRIAICLDMGFDTLGLVFKVGNLCVQSGKVLLAVVDIPRE